MKILVTGVSGQLGYDVCRELTARKIENRGVSSKELDITDQQTVLNYIGAYRPDAVIHCAAYTKVDQAEDEPDVAFAVNRDGTRNIAQACQTLDAKLIYISTDYVFPGTGEQFYEVNDPKGPLNVYGKSKLCGELIIQELLKKYFIVRISWAFGENGNNFIKTMLRLAETRSELGVVCDQIGSPTYTADLAPLLCDMVASEKYGVYHATNEGICSWAELAEEIFRVAGNRVTVHHIPTCDYPTPAVRPLNSRMSKEKLQKEGFCKLPEWKNAVKRYIEALNGASDRGRKG